MSVHPKALCGREMMLTGVDTMTKSVEKYGSIESASVINFVLDDVVYSGIEDPSDGYRSMMEKLEVGTSNSDEYYPCFVANFEPRNMACNVDEDSQAAAKARILARRAKRKEELLAQKAAAEAEIQQLQAARLSNGWGSF